MGPVAVAADGPVRIAGGKCCYPDRVVTDYAGPSFDLSPGVRGAERQAVRQK